MTNPHKYLKESLHSQALDQVERISNLEKSQEETRKIMDEAKEQMDKIKERR